MAPSLIGLLAVKVKGSVEKVASLWHNGDRIVSPLAINIPASDHPIAPPTVPLIDKLVQGVHAAYEADKISFPNELNSGKPWKISVGEWDAFVRDNGDCLIRAQVGDE